MARGAIKKMLKFFEKIFLDLPLGEVLIAPTRKF